MATESTENQAADQVVDATGSTAAPAATESTAARLRKIGFIVGLLKINCVLKYRREKELSVKHSESRTYIT
jgi:hypothetical protein